jgi:hypothetical protein
MRRRWRRSRRRRQRRRINVDRVLFFNIPPAWMSISGYLARKSATFGIISGWNFCPPKPGSAVYSLADLAPHVIGCRLSQETRIKVRGITRQAYTV